MTKNLGIMLIFILASCSEIKTNETDTLAVVDSSENTISDTVTKQRTPEYYIKLDGYRAGDRVMVQPVSFYKQTTVYSCDTAHKAIDTIRFNTSLKPVFDPQEGSIYDWMTVQYGNKEGCIQVRDIALQSVASLSNRNWKYFIMGSTLYKYDFNTKAFVDSLDIDMEPEDVKQINCMQWKNADLLLEVSASGHCCGCSHNQRYLIDANGKMSILFHISQYQDDGGMEEGYDSGYESYLHLPFNPQVDTIVYNAIDYGPILSKKGKYKRDKDGAIITGTLKEINEYYKWDGTKLVSIGGPVVKK